MSFDLGLADLESAAEVVHSIMSPTPQHNWPLLSERTGADVWVKHENHTPIGAFKVRGGLVYMQDLAKREPNCPGVITATRGNHGQSVALAATRVGIKSTILLPRGNSVEKNAAMRAFGGDLVEHGDDFQEAYERAHEMAGESGLHMLDSFHPLLISGVGTYGLEFFRACPDLDAVFVPVGLGSGICGVMTARDALGLKTKIYGVVSENAAAYALSFEQGKPVSTNSANTMADGMACRVPVAPAVEMINKGAEGIVQVSDPEIKSAMRAYFTDTHNIAEGAGAAPLAALIKMRQELAGKKVGLILSGGNVDRDVYQAILQEVDEPES
ncbi:MAG: threonine dehydratase [Rhodospirillaceae bacterium]|jgi:threonine dehydratase|nr:threonine dehydratase [Rhodospirillaceae bacterium]